MAHALAALNPVCACSRPPARTLPLSRASQLRADRSKLKSYVPSSLLNVAGKVAGDIGLNGGQRVSTQEGLCALSTVRLPGAHCALTLARNGVLRFCSCEQVEINEAVALSQDLVIAEVAHRFLPRTISYCTAPIASTVLPLEADMAHAAHLFRTVSANTFFWTALLSFFTCIRIRRRRPRST